jgi:transposase
VKCVCPMGGDRTCPDDCPLAVWASLSSADRKTQRKPLAEKLYKQGFTMEQIATQLGVTQGTISKDLGNLFQENKSKPAKTTTNPKGAGRPKGSTKPKPRSGPQPQRRTTTPEIEAIAASLVLDQGKTYEQAKTELGLKSVQPIKTAVRAEEGRREPKVERSDLSMTAQEKLDAAIRQHKRKLDMEFELRCREDCRRWLNEVSLPQYAKEIGEIERSIRSRKGVMDRVTYRKILACLHPDRVQDPALKKRYEEAFRLFTELEKRVLDEKQSPTQFRSMPRTYEELMAMKAKVQAARKAKRSASKVSVQ